MIKYLYSFHHGRMKPALVVDAQTIEVGLNKNSKIYKQQFVDEPPISAAAQIVQIFTPSSDEQILLTERDIMFH